MTLTGLVRLFTTHPIISETVADARAHALNALDLTLPPSLRPLAAAAVAAPLELGGAGRPVLLVTATYREAELATDALTSLLSTGPGDDGGVAYYPAWETLPHERLSPRSDTVGQRLAVLRRLRRPRRVDTSEGDGRGTGGDPTTNPTRGAGSKGGPSCQEQSPLRIVVAPVRSVLQPQVKGLADLEPVTVRVGEDYDVSELAAALVGAAYTRVDLVERRGEFAVRGGIVDVFPPTREHPARIDFFGDTVEEIRPFAVADQRTSDETIEEVTADPCRELLLTDEVRRRAATLAHEHPELAEMLDKIANGHAVDGMEALSPALVDGMELLVDLLPEGSHVLVSDPELIRTRAHDLVATSEEFLRASWAAAAGGGTAPIDLGASAYRPLGEVREQAMARGLAWWSLSPFAAAPGAEGSEPLRTETGEIIDLSGTSVTGVPARSVDAQVAPSWHGDTDAAVHDIAGQVHAGWRVVLVAEGRGTGTRMTEVLRDAGVPARTVTDLDEPPAPQVATVVTGELAHGFVVPWPAGEETSDDAAGGLAVYTLADLAGRRTRERTERRMPTRRKNQIDPLELSPGDPVVHDQYGVGRYVQMAQRAVAGATREYLVIEYAPSKRGQPRDRVYVPMDALDQVTRYVGGESPTLDKLAGGDWARRKGRARKAVRQIAAELIQLYAARQATRGHAFGPDTTWQRELEDAFAYIETPDQLGAITDAKHDMEQVVPMDRLICGDVGYGKTEIAVRAAFKAVQDGKQVAVLVPTTVLVQQHHATFSERYAGFPVRVEALSRFQTDREARQVREGIADGSVDVVVGTHRLLSAEVRFKDLGLVIIDEEQKFGVEHKEALKRLRTSVDVLAMSATPIPRTLEMAVTGIREMSTIATPPEERHPVLTFAGVYDEGQVTAAIRRELAREGQVFYIHNRVQSIEKVARLISELVPEARVGTAHGQMGEHRLEQVMLDFWQREIDVLVCTTIIESGLDIASANTLIIERADTMGLSQLHQLRGRVGRSRERGYAYFLYPPDRPLSETAHDRLATIAAHSELGSGMAIAMKDLEIRGAGNLLGGEQSGHIADVGFDLYIRLVGEAVAEFRGDGAEPEPEMRIELPVNAHLPADYVESERLRLEMYKRLAGVRSDDDLKGVLAELQDRYGEPGAEVMTLLAVARLRLRARAVGLTEIVSQGNYVRFGPAELPESRTLRLKRLYPGSIVKQTAGFILVPRPRAGGIGSASLRDVELLGWCERVITDILAA